MPAMSSIPLSSLTHPDAVIARVETLVDATASLPQNSRMVATAFQRIGFLARRHPHVMPAILQLHPNVWQQQAKVVATGGFTDLEADAVIESFVYELTEVTRALVSTGLPLPHESSHVAAILNTVETRGSKPAQQQMHLLKAIVSAKSAATAGTVSSIVSTSGNTSLATSNSTLTALPLIGKPPHQAPHQLGGPGHRGAADDMLLGNNCASTGYLSSEDCQRQQQQHRAPGTMGSGQSGHHRHHQDQQSRGENQRLDNGHQQRLNNTMGDSIMSDGGGGGGRAFGDFACVDELRN